MGILDGVGFHFDESMSGFLGVGETDPEKGVAAGRRRDTAIRFDVKIDIPDLGPFLTVSKHAARLTGTVTFQPLGGTFPIRDGVFNLFSVSRKTGVRQMVYAFRFTAADAKTYYFHGHKEIFDDPGVMDVLHDITRLFSVLYAGEDEQSEVYGAGVLRFGLEDAPSLVSSMRVTTPASPLQKMAAHTAFTSFAWGALRETYLRDKRLFYDTEYENLVLSGKGRSADGHVRPFFLVSGAHDKGFPWGDTECFWDVLLVVGDGAGGYRRFCVTDRVLDAMVLDVARGIYSYEGQLFELLDGYRSSFSAMRRPSDALKPWQARLNLTFNATSYDAVSVPFAIMPELLRKLSTKVAKTLEHTLPAEHPLGLFLTPHRVEVLSGELELRSAEDADTAEALSLVIDARDTTGEAERSTLRNFREPTLLYGYICSIPPDPSTAARVQIHTRTLRNERQHWAKDRLDALLGTALSRIASVEIALSEDAATVKSLAREDADGDGPSLFIKRGDPILEVNNDHYPTAVFQRRIINVADPSGSECLALEEDMTLMRLEPINSEREAPVAVMRDENKLSALDRVLDATGFDDALLRQFDASDKDKSQFQIAIKPNFMFSYNRRDRTSYTDPELCAHLTGRLRKLGFGRIAVVEAHSTYGEYFDQRSVKEVADYLGYHESNGYEIVDLTLDAAERQKLGPYLGEHPVPRTWRDADFRISFAKNKTHAYAYYTLTIKNVYGALPMANKFKEYHCERDIYHTTIEYLRAFPVHFGLVDATVSADGPFGVFADPHPNETQTVIGGPSLVATDWVAASKMGIDPLISKYMKLAVDAFGKPRIHLIGDANPYRPWLNVSKALTVLTHKGVDANYQLGNLFYLGAAQMDASHFHMKRGEWFVRPLRQLLKPLRRTFFVRTGKDPTPTNQFFGWLFYKMGS